MNDASGHEISDSERLQRLRLIRSENVGPITYDRLVERIATGEEEASFETYGKQKVTQALGRKGGKARARRVPPCATLCNRSERRP